MRSEMYISKGKRRIAEVVYRRARFRFPVGIDFSLLHRVQTTSGAHPASYPTVTGDSASEGKAAGAWHRPLTSIYC
jgi:hypothetical protein